MKKEHPYNKLLARQLRRKLPKDFEPTDEILELLKTISLSYDHYERDRKIIERAMIVSSNELRESYGKLAVQKELERKNDNLERFVSIASHDLKAPLRTINSFSGLLKRELSKSENSNAVFEYLDLIMEAAQRMDQLILDLLAYSRVESNTTEEEEVDLQQVLELVNKNLWSLLEDNQGTLHIGRLPKLKAIPHQMLQLFQNLIGNAIKFKKEDVAPIVSVQCEEGENDFTFSVQDNGIGISEDGIKKVFEPFKRMETGRRFAGTGLGLTICKSIVNKMGGKIWIESEEGVGTTFLFSLPKINTKEKFVLKSVEVEVSSSQAK